MKKLLLWVVIYLAGAVSGVVLNWTTSGAKDRGRIAALEGEVSGKTGEVSQCRNALEKCASALSPSVPAPPQQK